MDDDAVLVSNERSPSRKNRLVQVCNQCLPESISSRIKISCSDGSKWCTTQTECYDRILLDVPCSSERHVFADEKYLDMWSPSRIKSLAIEQWALLSSAYRLLRNDGFLLYSTCALNPKENDEVISRLVKKFPNAEICFQDSLPEFNQKIFNCCQIQNIPNVERTEFGFHILPDIQAGMGPIWFTLVHKKIVNNEDM
jgi:16S rRNA C967 or C1407 C5-methylase (RsmB/RsmF family)